MGYMRHHAFLVTTFSEEHARKAHTKAREIFGTLVSELNESIVNGYYSFAVFPDGSKEGWEDSDKGDEGRAIFKAWLNGQRNEYGTSPYDWVWMEVQYGDDNHETRIVSSSDDEEENTDKVVEALPFRAIGEGVEATSERMMIEYQGDLKYLEDK